MEFVVRTIRTLFYSLDRVVYGLIGDVYGLLMQISRTSVFSQETINEFSKRIYALVGLFMLFKISVSLINYVLNPDDFTDKEKGFTQIIKRVVLSLVMVVLVPYIFTEAYELQAIILEENTIMNIIFGAPAGGVELTPASAIQSAGQKIAFTVMYAFAQPNYEEFTQSQTSSGSHDLTNCQQTYYTYTNDDVQMSAASSGIHVGDYAFEQRVDSIGSGQPSKYIYKLNPQCWGEKDLTTDEYKCDIEGSADTGSLCELFDANEAGGQYYSEFQDYAHGVAEQNFNLFFRKEVILARESNAPEGMSSRRYFVNYRMGISTAVGIAVLYLLLMFCIDIAVRSIKLGFLQMIAPIPILSYCDPKSSKDGMFSKWVHMCTSTYLELFFRLAALFFGIYIISLVGTFRDVVSGKTVNGPIVSVFMIIGILIFVKKLPDIIKDIFNIKGNGKFTLNPMKKLQEEAFGGKQIMGVGKRAVGLGVGAAALGAGLATGQGLHRAGIGKALGGALRGDKFGKLFSNTYGAGHQRHQQLKDAKSQGLSHWDMNRSELTGGHAARAQAAYQNLDSHIKAFESGAAKEDKILDELNKRKEAAHVQGKYKLEAKFDDAIKARKNTIYTNTKRGEKAVYSGDDVRTWNDGKLWGAVAEVDKEASAGLHSRVNNVGSAVETVNRSVGTDYQVSGDDFSTVKKNASIQSEHFAADKDTTIRAAQMNGKGGKK